MQISKLPFTVATVLSLSFLVPTIAPAVSAAQDEPGPTGDLFTVDDLLDVVSVRLADLSPDGKWAVATQSDVRSRFGVNNYRYGDPTYISPSAADLVLFNTETGESQSLLPERSQVRSISWSPDSSKLALMLRNGDQFDALVWRHGHGFSRVPLPEGMFLDLDGSLTWTSDSRSLLVPLQDLAWYERAAARFQELSKGPITVYSSEHPFLAWDELRRMGSERSLVQVDLESGETKEILSTSFLSSYSLTEDGSTLRFNVDITKKTNYESIGGRVNRVHLLNLESGESRVLFESTRDINAVWSGDGRTYAYAKDKKVFVGSIDDSEPRLLLGSDEPEQGETEDKDGGEAEKKTGEPEDDEKEDDGPLRPSRLSHDGSALIATNKKGLWFVDMKSGEQSLFHEVDEDDTDATRYQLTSWTRDNRFVYFTTSSPVRWERGLARYDRQRGVFEDLVKDDRLYSGFTFSNDHNSIVFSSAAGGRPYDLFVAGAKLDNSRQLTQANPQLVGKTLSDTRLITYLDADGTKQNGVLYLPANYVEGTRYPTVFLIYETFFDNRFNGSINVLTSQGYAVMQPSVPLEQGYPGEGWLKGVTAAANTLIDMGIADGDRLGVHGGSYGGYATNLLITQTHRFKAAINISGKVNMVSFYTDSPRLGTRNIHAPERSQDRIGATLWEQPHKYIQHSAVMYADRIKTPLLLITGGQDHNVPGRQAMEMYFALRRLSRDVVWVDYVNSGHGTPRTNEDEFRDYHQRILDWYDKYLKKPSEGEETESPDAR